MLPGTPSVTLRAEAALPALVQIGIIQRIGDSLTLMAEMRRIDWKSFDRISFSGPALAVVSREVV